ncbi:hypothetical protein Syun_029550 [Stephania yunnanensis]|uniref:FAD-binding PCMH-type domain-containing protein n=1 Tax=Stephania yunnanensis TaxID=152371 RepID=A0AAP0E5U2_9MAGN
MRSWRSWAFLFCVLLSSYYTAYSSSIPSNQGFHFLECLTSNSKYDRIEFYAQNDSSYMRILQSAIRNLRFATPETPKPLFIVTPWHESQVQAVVVCSRRHGLQIRVGSGGHDFEGPSYASHFPFVMIDLVNLRAINVDIKDNSAWVQAGATIGELYYRIEEKSPVHGFPAGFVSTVGVGGHFSGGGYGAMVREYGLAADHIVDARLVNANAEILDRDTMGEDLFWAIRGGGAASFGVILAFKFKLVQVPPIVTVSEELSIQVLISPMDNNNSLQVKLQMMFLGSSNELVHLMQDKFPELGMKQKDCKEMNWVESVVSLGEFPKPEPLEVLLDRTTREKSASKVKSDFVTAPMSKVVVQRIFDKFSEGINLTVAISPFGGRMDEILEDEIPFPHRAGSLYLIAYESYWDEEDGEQGEKTSQEHMNWMRELYDYMRLGVAIRVEHQTSLLDRFPIDIFVARSQDQRREVVTWTPPAMVWRPGGSEGLGRQNFGECTQGNHQRRLEARVLIDAVNSKGSCAWPVRHLLSDELMACNLTIVREDANGRCTRK